jgi:hypothetical protein
VPTGGKEKHDEKVGKKDKGKITIQAVKTATAESTRSACADRGGDGGSQTKPSGLGWGFTDRITIEAAGFVPRKKQNETNGIGSGWHWRCFIPSGEVLAVKTAAAKSARSACADRGKGGEKK